MDRWSVWRVAQLNERWQLSSARLRPVQLSSVHCQRVLDHSAATHGGQRRADYVSHRHGCVYGRSSSPASAQRLTAL